MKKVLSATISEESYEFIKDIAKKFNVVKSVAVDLIIDAARGNLGEAYILDHYNESYSREDGRKKNGRPKNTVEDNTVPSIPPPMS